MKKSAGLKCGIQPKCCILTAHRKNLKPFILLKMKTYFSGNFFWVDIFSLNENLVQEVIKNLIERDSHPLFTVKIINQVEVKDLGPTASLPYVNLLLQANSVESNRSSVCNQELTIHIGEGITTGSFSFCRLNIL